MNAPYFLAALAVFSATSSFAVPVLFSASGSAAGDIDATVNSFRAALGAPNPNTPASFPDGRREINWDGVPAAASSPNAFPPDFFNGNTPGRARGILFSTPGSGFQVSDLVTPEFENINASYSSLFAPFSPAKLFTAIDSTITDAHSSSPAQLKPR